MKQMLMAALMVTAWLVPARASAAAINIGMISFDAFIPGAPGAAGVNAVDLFNSSGDPLLGGWGFGTEFPVLDFVTFTNASAVITFDDGTSSSTTLPDFGPGPLLDSMLFTPPVLLPDTSLVTQVLFQATLAQSLLHLVDGSTVTVDPMVSALLLPSAGSTLTAGLDLTPIAVETVEPTPVPEPSTLLLLACGAGVLLLRRRPGAARPPGV